MHNCFFLQLSEVQRRRAKFFDTYSCVFHQIIIVFFWAADSLWRWFIYSIRNVKKYNGLGNFKLFLHGDVLKLRQSWKSFRFKLSNHGSSLFHTPTVNFESWIMNIFWVHRFFPLVSALIHFSLFMNLLFYVCLS